MSTPSGRFIGIYTRISQDRNNDESAVQRQLEDCQRLIAQLVASNQLPAKLSVKEYRDNDISAFDTSKTRKRFEEMLRDVEAGRVEAIVTYLPDRLYRRGPDLQRVAKAVADQPHHLVHTVKGGKVDFSNPAGKLAASMIAAVAEYEIETKSVRQRSQSDQIAATGSPRRGGPRPFGYDLDNSGESGRYVQINEKEAAHLVAATERLLAGDSISSIVREWNRVGVTTVRGGKWHHSSFVALMTRPRNAAIRVHRGERVGPASWPPIVKIKEFDRVCALLSDPNQHSGGDRSRKHLLSFIIRCDRCGVGMRAAATHSRHRVYMNYQCPGGSLKGWRIDKDGNRVREACRRSINYNIANDAVRQYVSNRLFWADEDILSMEAEDQEVIQAMREQLAALSAADSQIKASGIELSDQLRYLAVNKVDRDQIKVRLGAVQERSSIASLLVDSGPRFKSGLPESMVDPAASNDARTALLRNFDNLSLIQRRQIIRALCVISVEAAEPGRRYRGFDSLERVLIYPRNPATGVVDEDPIDAFMFGAALRQHDGSDSSRLS